VPDTHAKHEELPVNPLLHRQDVFEVLPGVEEDPCQQDVHAAEPIVSLYVSAAHSVHTLPSAPVYPTLHWHNLLPVVETVLAVQLRQDVCAVLLLYFPASHNKQLPFNPYVPAVHATHSSMKFLW